MPTITLDKKDFIELLGKNVPDSVLKEKISMIGTDLDEFGEEIVVEIFPDRPDMLSGEGFAVALQGFLGIKKGLYKIKALDSDYKAIIEKSVKSVRPEAVCAVVKGVKLTDEAIKSLMQVQEKLHITHGRNRKKVAIGVHDLEKIDFPVYYTAKPKNFRFTPLDCHSDMSLQEILEKHAKGREFSHLLEGFDKYPIWIDSKKQVLSMPPVINAEETRVTEETKDLFLDLTGTDLRVVEQALNILLLGLHKRGGKIYKVKVLDVDFEREYPNLEPKKISLDVDYTNRLLGLNLSKSEIFKLLKKMRYGVEKDEILVPPYRADILSQVDVIEDVAIAYGYEKFEPEIPLISTIGEENPLEIFVRRVSNLMVGFQLLEVKNYYLTNKEFLFKNMELKEGKCVETLNAMTKEYGVLRNALLPEMMNVLKINRHHEYPQNIFEVGLVMIPDETFDDMVREEMHLACCICHPKASFTEAKEILDSLLRHLEKNYSLKEVDHNSYIPGRCGKVFVENKDIGIIGEIHPKVLKNWELEVPVSCFEIDLRKIFEME